MSAMISTEISTSRRRKVSKSNMNCCVYGCKSVAKKNPELLFHSFPQLGRKMQLKNDFGIEELIEVRILWENAIKSGKNIKSHTRVCSRHFRDIDYLTPNKNSIYSRRNLKKEAIPSLHLPQLKDDLPRDAQVQHKKIRQKNPDKRRKSDSDGINENAGSDPIAGCSDATYSLEDNNGSQGRKRRVDVRSDTEMDYCEDSLHYQEDPLRVPRYEECLIPVKKEQTLWEDENADVKDELLSENGSDIDIDRATGDEGQVLETDDELGSAVKEKVKHSINEHETVKDAVLERPIGCEILRVCRTCLKIMKIEDSVPLVTNRSPGNLDLYRKLTSILRLDLFPVDNPCLCRNCESFINAVHDFKVTCKSNEEVLKEFDWDNKTKDLLHVVDQDNLALKYKEVTREIARSSSEKDPKMTESDWEDLWEQLDEEGNGLSDVEDHWYHKNEQKDTGPEYAAGTSAGATSGCISLLADDDLFSPAFDEYFQRVGNQMDLKLKKNCRKFHDKGVGKGPVLCEFCGKTIDSNGSYKRHLKIHTSTAGLQCRECKEILGDWHSYREHCKLVHRIFKCQVCSKRYRYKKLWESHMKMHELENSKYCCFVCKKVFNNRLNLEKHRILHRSNKITCQFCGCRFHRNSLSRHIKLKHSAENIFNYTSTTRNFQCDMCENKYFSFRYLNLHKRQCHKRDNLEVLPSSSSPEIGGDCRENVVETCEVDEVE